jgi:hypothetical protein
MQTPIVSSNAQKSEREKREKEMNADPKRKSRQGGRLRAVRARRQHQEETLDEYLSGIRSSFNRTTCSASRGRRLKMCGLQPNIDRLVMSVRPSRGSQNRLALEASLMLLLS